MRISEHTDTLQARFREAMSRCPSWVTVVAIDCETSQLIEAGDHTVLLGRVRHVRLGEGRPVVYAHRGFHDLR